MIWRTVPEIQTTGQAGDSMRRSTSSQCLSVARRTAPVDRALATTALAFDGVMAAPDSPRTIFRPFDAPVRDSSPDHLYGTSQVSKFQSWDGNRNEPG
ncbi:hypothetical protein CA951_03130 [Rhodococcus sp. NCIMB 12038]|nr:hypothetical protein CA951_03130 [Rhodococcus sp. NCIMB 12038]